MSLPPRAVRDGLIAGARDDRLLRNGRGRIGVKATEDLSRGLLGLAQFEFKADTADNEAGSSGSNVSLSGRESYVGLKGGFGTIVAVW